MINILFFNLPGVITYLNNIKESIMKQLVAFRDTPILDSLTLRVMSATSFIPHTSVFILFKILNSRALLI